MVSDMAIASKIFHHIVKAPVRGLFCICSMILCLTPSITVAEMPPPLKQSDILRIALLNTALSQRHPQALSRKLSKGAAQISALQAILTKINADILILLELDFSANRQQGQIPSELQQFRDLYLTDLKYQYFFVAPVNSGIQTGLDLDQDGHLNEPEDALGYGRFPGQYAMGVLSRFPIDQNHLRLFQNFPWADLPNNQRMADLFPADFPLSSKSHWDIPVIWQNERIHLLISHPTPPVFDGPEDRNGRRNHDEIMFWHHYISPQAPRNCCRDDQGLTAPLSPDSLFIIAGDLNNDPHDGDSQKQAIHQLLNHPRLLQLPPPSSKGAVAAALQQGGMNQYHVGDPSHDTADFADRVGRGPGNLRVDFLLPSQGLTMIGQGVFWPTPESPDFKYIGPSGRRSSDHRLIWQDLKLLKTPE